MIDILKLNHYEIMKQLGEGGMGTVYKALDTRLQREVALKVIDTENFSNKSRPEVLARFDREARSLAKLSHLNIVPVLDYGNADGTPYLVMSLLAGGTLKDRLSGLVKPMPWQEAVKLIIPLAQALAYAHERGILHRDIKPSNILLTESGEPMLADFGLAKVVHTDSVTELTASGVGIGTPEYMAPEQGLGQPVDARTDIYALGIVFYEMVTGRKPFKADTPLAVMIKHINEPLPHPKSIIRDLPDRVEKVLLKALEKMPADRFASMNAFTAALDEMVSSQPAAGEKPRRGIMGWGIAGGLVGVLLLAWAFRSVPPAPAPSTGTPTATLTSTTPAPSQTPTKASSKTPSPARTITPTIIAAIFTPAAFSDVIGRVTASFAYVRYGPGSNFRAIVSVSEGDELKIVGRSEDGEWLVVKLTDDQQGWILSSYVGLVSSSNILAIFQLPPTPTSDYSPTPPVGYVKIYSKGDFNRDCIVDDKDYEMFKAAYNSYLTDGSYDSKYDLNHDGVISLADYGRFKDEYYGQTCTYKPKT